MFIYISQVVEENFTLMISENKFLPVEYVSVMGILK